jgi:hypothetical protein
MHASMLHIVLLAVVLAVSARGEAASPTLTASFPPSNLQCSTTPGWSDGQRPNSTAGQLVAIMEVVYWQNSSDQVWPVPPQTTVNFTQDVLRLGGFLDGNGAPLFNIKTDVLFSTWAFGVAPLSNTSTLDMFAYTMCAVVALTSDAVSSANFRSTYRINEILYGYTPVSVPPYLRRPADHDTVIFTVMGVIAAFFTVLQGAYGVYYVWATRGTMKKVDLEKNLNDPSETNGY